MLRSRSRLEATPPEPAAGGDVGGGGGGSSRSMWRSSCSCLM
jgi:hypothetical protein